MKINKIKKMKNGRYKIELDNNEKITLYEDVILENNLLFKKEIDNDILNKLNIDNEYYDIHNKVLKYISTKMRSELEINKYLDKYQITNKEDIINKFKNMNLINDELFVRAFISDKINLTSMGPYKIKNELLNHNIEEHLIDNELSKYDESIFIDKLKKIIDKKIKTNNKSEYMFKSKMQMELRNLGYDPNTVNNVLGTCKVDNNVISKEYDKLYKKLSRKYSDQELFYQIKNKLYIKGFKTDEINEEIKKRIE